MSELKQLDIALQFYKLLYAGQTGSREELADKLSITPRTVNIYKAKLEKILHITICYNRKSATYFIAEADLAKLPPQFRFNINYRKIFREV